MRSRNGLVVLTMSSLALYSLAFADALRPLPDLTVSEWADKHRILGRNSPEPGPWRTDRVPYIREIQDSLSPNSPVEMVILAKAAQGAGTEAILNAVGCQMAMSGGDILLVQPTTTTAKNFSRKRLAPMIEASPELRDRVAAPRSRASSNTLLFKEYAGGTLRLTGANSGSGLRSDPLPFLYMDEVDGYPIDIDDEGRPSELAIQRTANFRNRKIFMVSTPTLLDYSEIWNTFLSGDQRYYHVPCPLCGRTQELVWSHKDGRPGGIVWPKGKPEEARYQCEHCGDTFEEWRKTELLLKGAWVPAAPGNGGGKIRSYQISCFYYPYGWPGSSWPNLAAQWIRDHRDPIKLKTIVNLKWGRPWSDPSEAKTDANSLFNRRESYTPEIPAGAAVLTAGVDVQGNRLEAELVAWGPNEESWSIEYVVFPGDTSKLIDAGRSPWEALDAWLRGEWLSEYGVSLGIRACGIDSGFSTQTVTHFCGERATRRIFATKGKDGNRPVYSQKAQRQRGKFPPPHIIGVDTAKEHIYAGLRLVQPGPRFCHFPLVPAYELNYFEMLTCEIRIPDYTRPTPRFEWRKKRPGDRNEALDARVNAYWALMYLQATSGLRLAAEVSKLQQQADRRAADHKRASVTGLQQKPASGLKELLRSIDPVDS